MNSEITQSQGDCLNYRTLEITLEENVLEKLIEQADYSMISLNDLITSVLIKHIEDCEQTDG